MIPFHLLHCDNLFCDGHYDNIQYLHDSIITALQNSAKEVLQFTKPYVNVHKKSLSGWNDNVSNYKSDALQWHHIWLNCGCPESGYVFNMRKDTRKTYHKNVKFIHRNQSRLQGEKIASVYIESKTRDFWKEISKIRGKNKHITHSIEGLTDMDDISECFADNYNTLYNSVGYDCHDMHNLFNHVCNDVTQGCNYGDKCHVISECDVSTAIKLMKPGKSDGFDGLTSD